MCALRIHSEWITQNCIYMYIDITHMYIPISLFLCVCLEI